VFRFMGCIEMPAKDDGVSGQKNSFPCGWHPSGTIISYSLRWRGGSIVEMFLDKAEDVLFPCLSGIWGFLTKGVHDLKVGFREDRGDEDKPHSVCVKDGVKKDRREQVARLFVGPSQ
jgi:hypothetical protein